MKGIHKIIIPLLIVLLFSFGTVFGQEWALKESGTDATLYDLEFMNELTGVVVGGNFPGEPHSVILKTLTGGDEWIPQVSPVDERLFGVCFSSYENGWAVGSNGAILFSNGATWIEQDSGKTASMWDIFCIDDLTAIAVGGPEYGLSEGYHANIIKTTNGGEDWVSDLSGNDNAYLAVYFVGDTGYAVGGAGSVLKTTGGDWSEVGPVMTSGGITVELRDIHCLSEELCWVSGDSDELYYTDNGGDEWHIVSTGIETALHAVHFADENTGWAIGQQVIRFTDNGGLDWEYQVSDVEGAATDLGLLPVSYARTLEFVDDTDGWIVGDEGLILRFGEFENPCEEPTPVICEPPLVVRLYLEDDDCFSSFECVEPEPEEGETPPGGEPGGDPDSEDVPGENLERDSFDLEFDNLADKYKKRFIGKYINIYVTDNEKKNMGFALNKDSSVALGELYDKPHISVYFSTETLKELTASENKASFITAGLNSGDIVIKGHGLTKIKLFFALTSLKIKQKMCGCSC